MFRRSALRKGPGNKGSDALAVRERTARGKPARDRLVWALLCVLAAAWSSLCPAAAVVPGGPPMPSLDEQVSAARGEARIGYYLLSRTYRFQGQYSLTYNYANVKSSLLYAFADVDVEAMSTFSNHFRPDRLAGTFELGARHVGVHPLALFLRHQSPHDIDRADRKQGSWDMAGVRWEQSLRGGTVQISGGRYIRTAVFDYRWDLDIHADYPIGSTMGKLWRLRLDVHHVVETGPRGGLTDYWIEPNVRVAHHVLLFAGSGQVHDIDVFGGRTELPLITGVTITW
ncbi:MAG: hypothetical protein LC772_02605 [Chloroflexi bacterium]|nr:hypothetical protein [Chloroflexota bacterium]